MSNYIDKAWAENGDKTDIPVNAQGDGSVSYDQGFTDLYERDVATDPTALSLSRTNFNGDKNKITANLKQWLDQCYPDYYQFDNLGNPVEYKIYSAVRYNDGVYLSKVNNNTSLPTNTINWSLFQTLDFATEAEAIARTATDKWMNPFVTGKLIDNELLGNVPQSGQALGNTNLANLAKAGFYYVDNPSYATIANNYPTNNERGTLVATYYANQNPLSLMLVFTTYPSKKIFVNYTNGGILNTWTEIGGTNTDTLNPVGSLMLFPTNNIPAGYLVTDFSAVSRVGFANLFAVIGTSFGAGDGSTTFNLPPFDNDGAFLRGSGGNANPLGTYQGDAIRNITGGNINALQLGGTGSATGAFYSSLGSAASATAQAHIIKGFDASRVVPTALENRPINYSIKICIKT